MSLNTKHSTVCIYEAENTENAYRSNMFLVDPCIRDSFSQGSAFICHTLYARVAFIDYKKPPNVTGRGSLDGLNLLVLSFVSSYIKSKEILKNTKENIRNMELTMDKENSTTIIN